MLGYATANQIAEVQVSTNGGADWVNIYSQAGSGTSGESSFSTKSLSLSNFAGDFVLLRFAYHFSTSGDLTYFGETFTSPPVGWFIDNILLTNTLQLVNFSTNTTPTTNFTFTPTQTGGYIFQAAPVLFGQFPLAFGPVTVVTAISAPIITMAQPQISGSQVLLNFGVAAAAASTFELLQADQIAAAWITNSSAVLATNIPGSSYRFTTTVGPPSRFYRVQSP